MAEQYTNCDKETTVHQRVKVEAQVTVTPLVKHGVPKVENIYSCIKPSHPCHERRHPSKCNDRCSFILTQIICVEIPIELDVDVDVDKGVVCCGKPDFGPCKPECITTPSNDK